MPIIQSIYRSSSNIQLKIQKYGPAIPVTHDKNFANGRPLRLDQN